MEVGRNSSAASLLMAGIRGALDPSTAACRTDRRGRCWLLFYQPSFHGGGALLLQNLLPGTLMEAAVVHSNLSRAFSLILSLLHYIICCLALSCPFFLISLQLGTACTTPPHSNQPQTSRISPLQGKGVEMAESGLEISLTFHSFRSGSPFSSYHQTCHCWGYDAT